mmetsp:Transcript_51568/g.144086  ORF Transcript_51568/g.144086 Transcript_51568/m.144086 type:complete len:224 (+) Transcript_51568:812-1483(+)
MRLPRVPYLLRRGFDLLGHSFRHAHARLLDGLLEIGKLPVGVLPPLPCLPRHHLHAVIRKFLHFRDLRTQFRLLLSHRSLRRCQPLGPKLPALLQRLVALLPQRLGLRDGLLHLNSVLAFRLLPLVQDAPDVGRELHLYRREGRLRLVDLRDRPSALVDASRPARGCGLSRGDVPDFVALPRDVQFFLVVRTLALRLRAGEVKLRLQRLARRVPIAVTLLAER